MFSKMPVCSPADLLSCSVLLIDIYFLVTQRAPKCSLASGSYGGGHKNGELFDIVLQLGLINIRALVIYII